MHFDFLEPEILSWVRLQQQKMKVGGLLLLLTVLACCLQSVHSQTSFTGAEMESMLQTIDGYFFSAPRFNMEIRKFLRAAFHDCMGGCDGSINTAKTDNRGLEGFVQVITNAYALATSTANANYKIFRRLTSADFWALCEERALGWGIKNTGATIRYSGVTFSAGRSAPAASNTGPTETTLPNGAGGWAAMLTTLKTGIPTLTETDIVALLGLHGAGSAQSANSGFKGPWGPAQDKNMVNNRFFISLLNYGFPQSTFSQVLASTANFNTPPASPHTSPNPPTNLYEWVNSGQGNSPGKMMLPIDMQIYLSFTPDSTGYENQGQYCSQGSNQTAASCTTKNTNAVKYLPLAKTAPTALAYAKSNSDYLTAVLSAFLKMVTYTKPARTLTPFIPSWGCVGRTSKCLGDILFSGCAGTAPACP